MSRRPNPALPAGAVATIDRLLVKQRGDTCIIERPVSGTDAGGAPVSGWEQVGDPEPCKVTAPGRMPMETVSGGRAVPLVDYEVSFYRDVEVHNEWRIQHVESGRTLYIVADRDAVSYGFQVKVLVKTDQS